MTTIIRHVSFAVAVLIAAAAVGYGISLSYDVGLAHAEGIAPEVTPPPIPDDAALPPAPPAAELDDPLVAPMDAIDDFEASRRLGWPLAVLAVGIMLAKAVMSASKRWPGSGWLRWLSTGRRAFVIAGVLAAGSAAYDALLQGGTWAAVAWAAAGSVLAVVLPRVE